MYFKKSVMSKKPKTLRSGKKINTIKLKEGKVFRMLK